MKKKHLYLVLNLIFRGEKMYLNKDKILEALTKEDIVKIVKALGSEEPKTNNNGKFI